MTPSTSIPASLPLDSCSLGLGAARGAALGRLPPGRPPPPRRCGPPGRGGPPGLLGGGIQSPVIFDFGFPILDLGFAQGAWAVLVTKRRSRAQSKIANPKSRAGQYLGPPGQIAIVCSKCAEILLSAVTIV